MKKYIYLFLAPSLLLACSGNTESTEDSNDQVVDENLTPERAAKAQQNIILLQIFLCCI